MGQMTTNSNAQRLIHRHTKSKKSAFTALVTVATGFTVLSVVLLIYSHTLVTFKSAQNTRDYLRSVNQIQVNSFRETY